MGRPEIPGTLFDAALERLDAMLQHPRPVSRNSIQPGLDRKANNLEGSFNDYIIKQRDDFDAILPKK